VVPDREQESLGAERGRYPFDGRSRWHPPNKTAARGWNQGGGANDPLRSDSNPTYTSCGCRWQQRALGERTQAKAKFATYFGVYKSEHHAGLAGGAA